MTAASQHSYEDSTLAKANPVRTRHFQIAKHEKTPLTGLTSYDFLTAALFDQAGIDFLLVGDSLGNTVLGHSTTLEVTLEHMKVLGKAVTSAVQRAHVTVDMPFGSYEVTPEQALVSAIDLMKTTRAHSVKLEGGVSRSKEISKIVQAGIPVMGHIGFTPQSIHTLGGYRVQGRDSSAQLLVEDALAVEEAGAFCVVLEMIPSDLAMRITQMLSIPTIGIGAGNQVNGQILVWSDWAGLTPSQHNVPRFVKQYADLNTLLTKAVKDYKRDVASGVFPAEEHSFSNKT